MSKEIGRYDSDLQMFVEPKPLVPRMNHIRELRWRAENGLTSNRPMSGPRGDLVFNLTDVEIKNYAMQQADKELKPAPQSQFEQQH